MMDSIQTTCVYCEKQFSRKSNVLKHMRNVHKVQISQSRGVSTGSFHCLEENCMQSFLYGKDLRNHLQTVHSKFLYKRELTFTSIKEFYVWKSDYEEKEKVNFMKRTGNKKLENGDTIYYFACHRSGQPRKKENSSRIHPNSCKSGFMCTASITVNEKPNKTVVCTLYENHYGHVKDLGLLRLTDNEKEVIALKLANKMSIDDILKEIRDSFITKSITSRYDLTSRQDIKNIRQKYQLCEEQRHTNDAISVSLFINELKLDSEYNPILACKFQGENGEDFLRDLNINDIFLAIQHPVQREMLQKFGQNLVCVDSTHGTNKYGFNLITLLVIDEHHEGFPVAFCISNKEDKAVLKSFFALIKQYLPSDFCPQFFMSDDAPAYFNAWVDIFEKSPRKLLCAWHVQRALRLKLQNLIKDHELMCQVYKSLIILLEEKEEKQFQTLWSNVIDLLQFNENVKEFGKYFLRTYGCRMTEIAACYRLQAGVNTNMHLESFHRIFKYKFLGSKVNHRLDTCIFQLLEFIKDKAVERIRKLERGKLSNKLKMIHNRHKISLNLNLCLVGDVSEEGFKVKSSSCDKEYLIYVNKISCNCHMRCIPCEICIHNVSCNCLDFLIRNVICKHIHLVMRKIKVGQSTFCEPKFDTQSKNSSTECLSVGSTTNVHTVSNIYSPNSSEIHSLIRSAPSSQISKSVELIQKISSQIKQLNPVTQNNAIVKTNRILNDLSTFLNSQLDLSVHKLPSPSCQTVSIKTQRSFFSTKRKPKTRRNTIFKPLANETDLIKSEILNVASEVTDLLHVVSSEDHTYSKK